MYFVYIDESGDPGFRQRDGSITEHYTLSAVIIKDIDWLSTLNQLINFRRFLKQFYNIKMSDELKASYLVHNTGPFQNKGLSEKTRMKIYRKSLQLQPKLGVFTNWAIVIDKDSWENRGYQLGVLEGAWQGMIERLERFTTRNNEPCIIFPDEGNERIIRGALRRMRRYSRPNSAYGTARLIRNAELVLEDPNFRASHESYFVQLADINAYAASRAVFPKSYFGNNYWDYLGDSRSDHVNEISGGIRGIARKP